MTCIRFQERREEVEEDPTLYYIHGKCDIEVNPFEISALGKPQKNAVACSANDVANDVKGGMSNPVYDRSVGAYMRDDSTCDHVPVSKPSRYSSNAATTSS